jgi:ribosome modulation factor
VKQRPSARGRNQWLMALHKAELGGIRAAELGLSEEACPFRGKNNLVAAKRAAWVRGLTERKREIELDKHGRGT